MSRHSNRKPKGRKNPRRSAAGKKSYKKTGLYKYNQRRKKGGKSGKKVTQRRKKSRGRKKSYGFLGQRQRHRANQAAGVARAAAHAQRKAAGAASRQMYAAAKASFIGRGYTSKQAGVAAKRYVKMLKYAASRAQHVGQMNAVEAAYRSGGSGYAAGFAGSRPKSYSADERESMGASNRKRRKR
jgi:hypothetical protein